jgi:hypothetical protein
VRGEGSASDLLCGLLLTLRKEETLSSFYKAKWLLAASVGEKSFFEHLLRKTKKNLCVFLVQ